MSCLPSPEAFGLGSAQAAADFGAGVAQQAATELPGFGAGVLAGTLPEGLNSIGSIVPELAGGALSGVAGAIGGASGGGGGGSGGGGSEAASLGVPTQIGGGSPVSGALSSSASPTQGALSTAAGPTGGPLGGAAASAAPTSAPVSPTTAGTFGSAPSGDNFLVGANTTSPVAGASLSGTPLSSMPGTDPTAAGANAAPTAADAAKGATSVDKFLADPSLKTGFGVLSNNANLILPAAGLVTSALMGNRQQPQETALNATAKRLADQGQTLQGYLQSGTLPPGLQSGLSSAGAAAKATIRSRHAASGTSGSSSEAQELAGVDSAMVTQGANMALSLFQSGLSETQVSNQLYQALLSSTLQQDDQLAQAIGRFASAAAGGGTTIRLGT